MTVHKQIRDFECEKCGKKFAMKYNRNLHLRVCKSCLVVEESGVLARQAERVTLDDEQDDEKAADGEDSEPVKRVVSDAVRDEIRFRWCWLR